MARANKSGFYAAPTQRVDLAPKKYVFGREIQGRDTQCASSVPFKKDYEEGDITRT
jgi:hypothetical protein